MAQVKPPSSPCVSGELALRAHAAREGIKNHCRIPERPKMRSVGGTRNRSVGMVSYLDLRGGVDVGDVGGDAGGAGDVVQAQLRHQRVLRRGENRETRQ